MGNLLQLFQHQNWVRAGEHVALRIGSLLFSMVSAHAILWFYDSLAKVDAARAAGQEVTLDVYPYPAGSTRLAAL